MTPMPILDAVALTVAAVVGGTALVYGAMDFHLVVSNWLHHRRRRRAP